MYSINLNFLADFRLGSGRFFPCLQHNPFCFVIDSGHFSRFAFLVAVRRSAVSGLGLANRIHWIKFMHYISHLWSLAQFFVLFDFGWKYVYSFDLGFGLVNFLDIIVFCLPCFWLHSLQFYYISTQSFLVCKKWFECFGWYVGSRTKFVYLVLINY